MQLWLSANPFPKIKRSILNGVEGEPSPPMVKSRGKGNQIPKRAWRLCARTSAMTVLLLAGNGDILPRRRRRNSVSGREEWRARQGRFLRNRPALPWCGRRCGAGTIALRGSAARLVKGPPSQTGVGHASRLNRNTRLAPGRGTGFHVALRRGGEGVAELGGFVFQES